MTIKICGMRDPENIKALDQAGIADWMGFIFYPPSPRHVSALPSYMPRHSKRVGVFVNQDRATILQRQKEYNLDILQLHGNETPDQLRALRNAAPPHVQLIKTIPVSTPADTARALNYQDSADYLLFETKTPNYGGSGTHFDWDILSEYHGTLPFLLTGGIGPGDAEAILSFRHPRLAGIDLNSKFELSPALKDIKALQTFITTIKQQHTDNTPKQ